MKVKIFRFLSALVKTHQIPHVIFETKKKKKKKMKENSSVLFRPNVIYFSHKGPIKVQITETSECLDQNSPNPGHF